MHLLSFSIRKRKELRWFRCQAILRIDEAMATGRNNDDVMRRAGERGSQAPRSQPTHHQTHARSSGQQASSGSRWERRATSLLPHGSTGPPQRGERPAHHAKDPAARGRAPPGKHGVGHVARGASVDVAIRTRTSRPMTGSPTAWMCPVAKPTARIFCASPRH